MVAIKRFQNYTFQLQYKENKKLSDLLKVSTETQDCGEHNLNIIGLGYMIIS
jgi:hypothetical protein